MLWIPISILLSLLGAIFLILFFIGKKKDLVFLKIFGSVCAAICWTGAALSIFILFILFQPSNKVSDVNVLPGKYRLEYGHEVETLTLFDDGTLIQVFKNNKSNSVVSNTCTWDYSSEHNRVFLNDVIRYRDNKFSSQKGVVAIIAEYSGDTIRLYISKMNNLYYRKIN